MKTISKPLLLCIGFLYPMSLFVQSLHSDSNRPCIGSRLMKQLMSTLFFFCCAFQPLYSQSEYNEQKLYQVMETDTMPIYKGGYMALLSYINNTLIYPQIYNEASIQGRVICQLIIEKDGTISSVKVIRGIDKYLDEEVVRVVKSMPKWLPGKRRGDAVRVEYYLPVICRIR